MKSVVRLGVSVSAVALVAFHAVIFARRVAGGALEDPGVALRWAAAAGLALAIVELRRRGRSLLGRESVAVWVLAALLHGPALTRSAAASDAPALPEGIASVLQIGLAAAGLGLLLLADRAVRTPGSPEALRAGPRFACDAGAQLVGPISAFAPRPPPLV
jgi:hypothetical protein